MGEGHLTDVELTALSKFELTVTQAAVMDEHLRSCPNCNRRYRSLAPRPAASQEESEPVPLDSQDGAA